MRRCTKKADYHATRIIQIILLLIFPLRSCSVNGQISHHTDYEIAAGRRSGGGASGGSGGANNDSNEDESITNQPNGMHTNGEILGPKSFPLSAQEPSCEELRAMWIFSKRQSRAAEMSNEIPTYRDPFAYNVWEPIYPTAGRGIGSRTISHYREPTRPVFGRVISREPVVLQRLPVRTRLFDDVPSRLYGSETRSAIPSISNGVGPRRYMQYRFSGTPPYGSAQGNANNPNIVHQGSFQKLKELIWTERAKELTQQRKAEELAARAAVLKEISAGQLINRQPEQNDEPMPNEENLSPDQQDHPYHHNTDGRISIGNGKQPGVMKSIFSGNPSNPNSARSGRLLLPSMIGGDVRERGNLQRNFPMRPSHFRERNRVLFRQSTPSDFYQRESRSGSPKSVPLEHQTDINSRPYSFANDRDSTDSKNNQYQTNILYPNTDFQYPSEILQQKQQQPLNDMFQKLYQIDQIPYLAGYPTLTSKTKFNYDDNISIERSTDNNSRKRRDFLSNIDFIKHSLSSDSY